MTGRPFRAAHSPGPKPPFAPRRAGGPRPCPELATERLTLGPLGLDDWPAYRAEMTSERVDQMGGPYDDMTAWGWFCIEHGGWALTGTGGVAARAHGALVAVISFNDLPAFAELEIGWMTTREGEGRGYATEAAAAVLAWIRAEVRPASLVSYVGPENPRSRAVAQRLGAALDRAAWVPDAGDEAWRHEMGAAA